LGQACGEALAATGQAQKGVGWAAYWAAKIKVAGAIGNISDAAVAAVAREAAQAAVSNAAATWEAELAAATRGQAALVRDIMGNPFQRTAGLDPSWLLLDRGVVHDLAAGIYETRAFDHLPVLADALEEAGCADDALLAHCRGPAEHARGCWALDLILARDR
jgi:hypothetical protein